MRIIRSAAVTIGLALTLVAVSAGSATASSERGGEHDDGGRPFTFGVIGDIPYGPAQIAAFPAHIAQINADPQVSLVNHLGDIKNGSSRCDDSYFATIKADFDQFRDPLVYTPGDNEWTDCHRPSNGAYNPLERLTAVRDLFFPRPGVTLGQRPVQVDSQEAQGFVENVRYERDRVAFAAVHIVGSNNSLAPWTGNTGPTAEQSSEVLGRTAADIALIRDTFAAAKRHSDRAVVLFTQADMFDITVPDPAYADYFAFTPIVAALIQESNDFAGPVYLFNGDSHVFNQDNPLAAGSKWLAFYGQSRGAANFNRITVEGSADVDEWVKVSIDKKSPAVLTWQRVPFK